MGGVVVVVIVCLAFDLTVLEANTEIMCLHTKGMLEITALFSVEAVGQVYVCMYVCMYGHHI